MREARCEDLALAWTVGSKARVLTVGAGRAEAHTAIIATLSGLDLDGGRHGQRGQASGRRGCGAAAACSRRAAAVCDSSTVRAIAAEGGSRCRCRGCKATGTTVSKRHAISTIARRRCRISRTPAARGAVDELGQRRHRDVANARLAHGKSGWSVANFRSFEGFFRSWLRGRSRGGASKSGGADVGRKPTTQPRGAQTGMRGRCLGRIAWPVASLDTRRRTFKRGRSRQYAAFTDAGVAAVCGCFACPWHAGSTDDSSWRDC